MRIGIFHAPIFTVGRIHVRARNEYLLLLPTTATSWFSPREKGICYRGLRTRSNGNIEDASFGLKTKDIEGTQKADAAQKDGIVTPSAHGG